MMHGKLKVIRADTSAEKAASNRGRGRRSGPGHTPKMVGLYKSRLMGRLVGRQAADEDENVMQEIE